MQCLRRRKIQKSILALNVLLLLVQLLLLTFWIPRGDEAIQGEVKEKEVVKCATPSPAAVESPDHRAFWKWHSNWDGREPSNEKNSVNLFRRLFLVRHGQYYGTGSQKGHLSTIGKKQAHLTGERLRNMNITFHKFTTSSSVRAVETANILYEYIPYLDVHKSSLLKEGWPTYPEPPISSWDPTDPQFTIDGDRISWGYSTVMYRADSSQKVSLSNELLVAHGNVISYIVLRSLQLPPERWLKLSVLQGSITLLEISPDGHVTARAVGDVGHIPFSEWTG